MTVEQWDAVNEFVESVGWEFIFGRAVCGSLVYYAIDLFLEKNNITAVDHAKDFFVLKELIEREKPLGRLIVGPDVAKNASYFIT